MDEICTIANDHEVDAVVIAGDIFDTYNPPTEAMELFYRTVKRLAGDGTRAVIAMAGNHDSPDRITAPDVLARECGIILAGYPKTVITTFKLETGLEVINSDGGYCEIKIPGCDKTLRAILTPYANEYRMKTMLESDNEDNEFRDILKEHWASLAEKYCDQNGVNILVTHLFMIPKGSEMPEEPDDEKPILHAGGVQAVFSEAVPKQIHYTALGHLHRPQNMSLHETVIRYSGSPVAYSFSEAEQKKSVTIVSFENNLAESQTVALKGGKELLRLKFNSVEEALTQLPEHEGKLIELTISSDNYLTAVERRSLEEANSGIVSIIPDIQLTDEDLITKKASIDVSKNINDLFASFFESRTGQTPNEELTELFKEITSVKL